MSRRIAVVPSNGSRLIIASKYDGQIRVAGCIALTFIAWMLPRPFKPRGCR